VKPDARLTSRSRWSQRALVITLFTGSVIAMSAAVALATGQWVVSSRNLVTLAPQIPLPGLTGPQGNATPGVVVTTPDGFTPVAEGFPTAEPEARNFLVTGTDNNACLDPDSPFAGGFGDRDNFGERSDTIMVWRVNPSTRQVAVLSFPRDLYVDIAGGGKARINTAFRTNDPERLRATILNNFGIPIDHYVQVDFCAFQRMVDAVGGVEVPFAYPARDAGSGLNVPVTGCFNFAGDHALAYVRSRAYQYENPPGSGNWRRDGTGDWGRIARQQDFLRRTVATVLSRGLYTPSVVAALIETNSSYLTMDSGLTLNRLLQFAGVIQGLDPMGIGSYQIESTPEIIAGNAVLVPRIRNENMRAILDVFRGAALLSEAPPFEIDGTPPTSDAGAEGDPGDGGSGDDEGSGGTEALPTVTAEENLLGIAPPRNMSCP
jgi:LCP family protein required for cell wall assembly